MTLCRPSTRIVERVRSPRGGRRTGTARTSCRGPARRASSSRPRSEDALRVLAPRMREQELAEAVRQHDLAGVQVAGEDQVPAARLGRCRARAESGRAGCAGRRRGRRSRWGASAEPRARIDAGELDAPAAQLDDLDGRVEQQRPVLEPAELDRTRERVARDRVVVVAEHDVRMRQLARAARAAVAPPRGRESRSPVTQTRSGCRSATQSTARSTARAPRDGTPRWKSERCAIRRPSSSGGSPGSASSRTRRRTQPASNQP